MCIRASITRNGVDVGQPVYRGIAIGTGIGAIAAIAVAVALSILFPPFSMVFIVGVSVVTAVAVSLGVTSIIHAVKASKG